MIKEIICATQSNDTNTTVSRQDSGSMLASATSSAHHGISCLEVAPRNCRLCREQNADSVFQTIEDDEREQTFRSLRNSGTSERRGTIRCGAVHMESTRKGGGSIPSTPVHKKIAGPHRSRKRKLPVQTCPEMKIDR